jgi:predicted dehydrogenase
VSEGAAPGAVPGSLQEAAPGRLRLVLVGAGAWGQNLLRVALGHPRVEVVAVVDPSPAARQRSLEKAPRARVVATVTEALALSPAAALVATPARTHAPLALALLDAGLDVFVEKPLATTPHDADAIAALARRRRRVAMVGHLLRYHPAFEALIELSRSGQIGRLRTLETTRLSPPGRPGDVSALWALGPHDLSMLHALDPSPLVALDATISPPDSRHDEATITCRTAAGLEARLILSRSAPRKTRQFILTGDLGTAFLDDLDPASPLRFHPHGGPSRLIPLATGEPLARELDAFVTAVERRASPLTSADEGALIVRWLDEAERRAHSLVASEPASAACP